jgi:hypothetical protein
MNHSIIKIALSSKFSTEQIDNVMEIAAATPNPEVAVEILLGIYQPPVIPVSPVNLKNFDSSKRNIVFSHYDKYNEQVSYKYFTMKTVSGWIENGVDVDPANIASNNRWSEDAARNLRIDEKVFKENYTYHTFDIDLEKDSEGNPKLYSSSCELYTWMDTEKKRK